MIKSFTGTAYLVAKLWTAAVQGQGLANLVNILDSKNKIMIYFGNAVLNETYYLC